MNIKNIKFWSIHEWKKYLIDTHGAMVIGVEMRNGHAVMFTSNNLRIVLAK